MPHSKPILLDTCVIIKIADEQRIRAEALNQIRRAYETGIGIYVSPISAWEIGALVSRGKITLSMPALEWFDRFLESPNVWLADLNPKILISSSFLPGNFHKDPADRIITATAIEYGMTIATTDRLMIAYAGLGHVSVLAC